MDRADRQDCRVGAFVGQGHITTQSAFRAIAKVCNIRVGPVVGKSESGPELPTFRNQYSFCMEGFGRTHVVRSGPDIKRIACQGDTVPIYWSVP